METPNLFIWRECMKLGSQSTRKGEKYKQISKFTFTQCHSAAQRGTAQPLYDLDYGCNTLIGEKKKLNTYKIIPVS